MFNQNRSINYQLSNLKYLHEGWTVRPSTPIDLELDNMDEEEFNLIARETVDTIDEKVLNIFKKNAYLYFKKNKKNI